MSIIEDTYLEMQKQEIFKIPAIMFSDELISTPEKVKMLINKYCNKREPTRIEKLKQQMLG